MPSTPSKKPPCEYSTALDLVPPAHIWVPDGYDPERTLGPAVAATAALAGFPPDPEQRMLLDLAFALDKDGKSLAFEVVLIAPRQNLKTGFLKQYAMGQLFVRHEELVPWSAHEFGTAAEALNDVEALIDGSDILRSRIELTTRGGVAKRGAIPEIKLTRKAGGGRMIWRTRTAGGGRGLSGRKVILDEAYAVQAAQTGALYPIMLAQPDPQVIAASSACRPESAVLWDMVRRGRAGGHQRMVYVEWCAPGPETACDAGEVCTHGREVAGCGCDKPEVIELAHTAIRRGRIQLQSVMDLRTSLPVDEFCREIMGWHDLVVDAGSVLDVANWPHLLDEGATMAEPACFALSVSQDRGWASIGAAGSAGDGKFLAELIDRRPGTAWVVARCKELAEAQGKNIPFAIDNRGPAASLMLELQKAGLTVLGMSASDAADATEEFLDSVKAGTIVHGPQPEVDDALLVVRPREVGDGRSALGRKASKTDITALEVLVFALWGARRSATPQVWSLSEMAAQILAERAENISDPPTSPQIRPDGSTFVKF